LTSLTIKAQTTLVEPTGQEVKKTAGRVRNINGQGKEPEMSINLLEPELFFIFILAHPVYKM